MLLNANPMAPTAADPAGFELVKGERFAVTLPSNRTTGYQWQLGRPLDERVVKLIGSEYRAPDSRQPGAGGSEVWIFEARGPGEATIILHYVRPWEKSAPPARTDTFTLLVR